MAGLQLESAPAIQAFLQWRSRTESRRTGCSGSDNTIGSDYISQAVLQDYLTTDRIKTLLKELFDDTSQWQPNADRVRSYYLRPFAILLSIRCGSMIRHFVDHPELQDKPLPFSTEPEDFPKTSTQNLFEAFYKEQWQFCAVPLEWDMNNELANDYILPITAKEEIGNGGSGILYKITVDEEYNRLKPAGPKDRAPKSLNPNTFALKTYRTPDAKKYFENERNAFVLLRNGDRPAEHIIEYYGSFVRDGIYNIILEYADRGTLDDYMKNTTEPKTMLEISTFWERFLALMHGLVNIHGTKGYVSEGPNVLLGWHHSIDPSNILVVSRSHDSSYDCDFKIANLGLAHFQRYISSLSDATDNDRYGISTHDARERYRSRDLEKSPPQVSNAVDVFSLGCVWSQFATMGSSKLHEYGRRRQKEVAKKSGVSLMEEGWFYHVSEVLEAVSLGHTSPDSTIDVYDLSSRDLVNWEHISKAISLLEQDVQIRQQTLAEDHPDRLASQYELARAYRANGQFKEAVSLLGQVVQIEEQTLAVDHPHRLALQHELGRLEDATVMKKKRSILGEEQQAAAKHEAGWEEDSGSVSDLSEVSSAQSMPSLVSDSSSASLRDKYGPEAAEHLAGLLVEDPILNSLYAAAIPKIDPERFHKNHDQLLKAFFKDLRPETRNTVELATVRGLRSRDRRQKITSLIRNTFEPPNILKQEAMTMLRDQRPNRMQVLDDYLGELASDDDPKHSNVAYGHDDESGDGGGNSNSSNENDDRPMWQNDEETHVHLEPLELFITNSNAFARFKSNFGYLLRPPTHLSEALGSRDIYIVQRFLAKNFASAANADHEWLHELDEAGYSKQEIAELLLENTNDSPWIYFTPRVHVRCHIQNNFHVPGCAHVANTSNKPQSLLYSGQAHPSILHTDLRRQVEELCGIGGVIPSSRDMSSWYGSVTFEKQSSVSSITYAATPTVTSQTRRGILVRTSSVLNNFCTTAAAVQANWLCCDAFTALFHIQDCLNLRRIELYHATKMASYMREALEDNSTEAAIRHCAQSAKHILQELIETLPNTTPDDDLHYCALAAQFLCVAFLSYTQAHVGPVDPFFLDTPQREMVLLGSQHMPGDFAVKAELVKLTCLAEMTQQPVLAFSSVGKSGKLRKESEFDVLSSAEDFLDTWGPGYFVHNKVNPSKVHAIALDRGFVFLADSEILHFHWTTGRLPESALRATFEPRTMMRIGAPVRINVNCYVDEAACRKSSFCALEQLGTHEIFWELQERQAGFQGGHYINGSLLQTWKKSPGTTLKQSRLQQNDWRLIEFLEQSWGLQVSFCTSVARRVSLRELVTDLLPIFVTPLGQNDWQELVNRHHIIQAFSQGDLGTWLRPLSLSLQGYVLSLVGKILRQLQHTGFDRQNTTLVIAWPQEGDIERGFKIPCKEQTYWAQILADAEDCATFAYVTPKCLETNHVKCQGSLRAWQNASKMLVTEISPSRPNGEPVITTALAPVTTTATATTQWKLEDKKIYFIKKLDTLLQVKVERPNPSSNDVAHLVVADSIIPPGWWKRVLLKEEQKRNYRIRERQAIGDHAEHVIVRAG